MVNAVHSSQFVGWKVTGKTGQLLFTDLIIAPYILLDTALTLDMKLIPLTCPPLLVCHLPIGDNFTMGYEDAIIRCC